MATVETGLSADLTTEQVISLVIRAHSSRRISKLRDPKEYFKCVSDSR